MRWVQNSLRKLHRLTILGSVVSLIIAIGPAQAAFAVDPNQLFITPASSQMNTGTTFTVNVKRYDPNNSSTGSVNGTVTYPANLLRVLDTPRDGSAYGSPNISLGNGTINFSGTLAQSSGSIAQVFAITFQATGGGTATVSFANNSQVNNSTTIYKSGVYTIINPNPSSPPPSSTPKPSATPTPLPTTIITPSPTPQESIEPEPQPTPDPTGLVDTVTIDPLYSSATVGWKVNAANPTSTMSYGKTATQLDKTATVSKKPDGSFSATVTSLTPGVRYYFSIAGSGDGGKTGNYSGTIITRGFPLIMTITENQQPAKNAQVKIGSRSYTTTADGKLSIGLASGNYSGTITTETSSLSINLTVEPKTVPTDGSAPPAQTFAYNLTSSALEQGPGSGTTILSFIGVLLGGTVILGFGFVGFMAYRRRKFENETTAGTVSSTVIVEDGYDWHSEESAATPIGPPSTNSDSEAYNSPLPTNSVYIADEEPLDIFERAEQAPLPSPHQTINVPQKHETQQTPNLPHSTMP